MCPLLFLSLSQSLYVSISVYVSPSLFNLCLLSASTSLFCVFSFISVSWCLIPLCLSSVSLYCFLCLCISSVSLSPLCLCVSLSLHFSLCHVFLFHCCPFCLSVCVSVYVGLWVCISLCVFFCVLSFFRGLWYISGVGISCWEAKLPRATIGQL